MKSLSKKTSFTFPRAPKLVAIEAIADSRVLFSRPVSTGLGKNPSRKMTSRTSGRNRTKK